MFFAEPAAFFVAMFAIIPCMGSKIKTFLSLHRADILTVVLVLLTLSAAFQMGRLSVLLTTGESAFRIYDSR